MIGWVKENMHYTGSVIRHMTRAAAFAGDSAEGWTLLRHYSQEWDHYALFRAACASVGVDSTLLEQAPPLPSTRAVTDLMRSIARMDPLVYNACEAMLEATAERPPRVVEYFDHAQRNYDYPDDFIKPLVEHLHVDEEFEHIDIFDGLVAGMRTVSFDLMSDIMRACHSLALTMRAWHAHIADVYGKCHDVSDILALV
jgi:pyrroloquinoline quinone (PQQ) biosynthesis protein C